MSKLKSITVRATPEFIEALDNLLKQIEYTGSRADYILNAIADSAHRDGVNLPAAKAPHGVRSDVLPQGWLSRLYPDRYQLVATITANDIIVEQLHEIEQLPELPIIGTVRAEDIYPGDGRKVEVTVYGVTSLSRDAITIAVMFAVREWWSCFEMDAS